MALLDEILANELTDRQRQDMARAQEARQAQARSNAFENYQRNMASVYARVFGEEQRRAQATMAGDMSADAQARGMAAEVQAYNDYVKRLRQIGVNPAIVEKYESAAISKQRQVQQVQEGELELQNRRRAAKANIYGGVSSQESLDAAVKLATSTGEKVPMWARQYDGPRGVVDNYWRTRAMDNYTQSERLALARESRLVEQAAEKGKVSASRLQMAEQRLEIAQQRVREVKDQATEKQLENQKKAFLQTIKTELADAQFSEKNGTHAEQELARERAEAARAKLRKFGLELEEDIGEKGGKKEKDSNAMFGAGMVDGNYFQGVPMRLVETLKAQTPSADAITKELTHAIEKGDYEAAARLKQKLAIALLGTYERLRMEGGE